MTLYIVTFVDPYTGDSQREVRETLKGARDCADLAEGLRCTDIKLTIVQAETQSQLETLKISQESH